MKNKIIIYLLPLVLLACVTPLTSTLDMAIGDYFYHRENGFSTTNTFTMIYHYGILPAWICCGVAGALYTLSHYSSRWQHWKKPALALIFSFAIGSGLIANALLKENWGRPRPRQVVDFGGTEPYQPYYMPRLASPEHEKEMFRSFPSGHATTGFYFFSLAIAGQRLRKRKLIIGGTALALVLGCSLSITRIAQGGHFFSDCLVSAVLMWLVAVTCDAVVHRET